MNSPKLTDYWTQHISVACNITSSTGVPSLIIFLFVAWLRSSKGTYKYYVITFRDIFTPHPPFPTASSFGTLVGGAHLMMSYLNKHFEPVPILCAVDFCLESRPVNPIVYLVKKKWEWNTKILIIFVLSIQNVQYVTVRIPSCRWFESVMMFL